MLSPHLQVRILSAPQAVSGKIYPHITLAVKKGALAKDANSLPDAVKAGTAQRWVLPEPLQLTGQILGFLVG